MAELAPSGFRRSNSRLVEEDSEGSQALWEEVRLDPRISQSLLRPKYISVFLRDYCLVYKRAPRNWM